MLKKLNKRNFHNTGYKANIGNSKVIPVITYINIEGQKSLILNNNKGKTGIYCWTNLINSKSYIGSANDLRTRFYVYFSSNRLMNSKMTIYKGILKYGYSNFKLDILEYCTPNVLLEREQYYIDLIKPEYNNLRIAGSSIGYKHTIDALKKFRTRKVSEITRANLAKAARDRVLTDAARAKISLARTGIILSDTTKAKLSAIASAKTGLGVKVMDITTGNTTEYLNLTLAALALGVSRTAISKALVKGNLIKKTYLITRT